jgi:hypothetical protein
MFHNLGINIYFNADLIHQLEDYLADKQDAQARMSMKYIFIPD